MKKNKKIAIFGHYGNNNYGDESIIEAIIDNIKQRSSKNVDISCFSINPKDSNLRHSVDAFPIRRISIQTASNAGIKKQSNLSSSHQPNNQPQMGLKKYIKRVKVIVATVHLVGELISVTKQIPSEIVFLHKSYKNLKKYDLLIVTGSNQFMDSFGGVGGFPYTLFKWAILCKLARVKLVFASVGAGPIYSKLSMFLIRMAVLMGDYVSYRDDASKKMVESSWWPINGYVYPDIANSLEFQADNYINREKRIVGINPMPVHDNRYWYNTDQEKYKNYILKLSEFVEYLIENGHSVYFFNTMVKDLNVIDDILSLMPQEHKTKVRVEKSTSVSQLMKTINMADLIVATRFHGTVLSLVAEKPIISLYYHIKSRDFIYKAGFGEYALDMDNFDAKELLIKFESMIQNLKIIKEKVVRTKIDYIKQLDEQYEKLIELIN